MSELTKTIAELQRKKIIHIAKYRKSERTGLDVPVYSLSAVKSAKLEVHGLLAGVTSERLVEYDFVARNLPAELNVANILDIGAAGSGLVQTIREFKTRWQVLGTDLAQGSDTLMDARSTGFRDEVFDQVISISTIEHVAIDDKNGDVKVMQEIYRILKKGGSAIITVPYGRSGTDEFRIYDLESLAKLAGHFKVAKKEFYCYDRGKWLKCIRAVADRTSNSSHQIPLRLHSAVCVCLLLKKQ